MTAFRNLELTIGERIRARRLLRGWSLRFAAGAERIAPQHFRSSALARETTRVLLERSRRSAGGTELRGLCERMHVG